MADAVSNEVKPPNAILVQFEALHGVRLTNHAEKYLAD